MNKYYLAICLALIACTEEAEAPVEDDMPPVAPLPQDPQTPPETPPAPPLSNNSAPIVQLDVSAARLDERQPLTIDARGSSDVDGDTLSYSIDLGSLPYEQVSSSHSGRVWTIITSEVDATATYEVTVSVSDGAMTSTKTEEITVENYARTPLSTVWDAVNHSINISDNGTARFSENDRSSDFQMAHVLRAPDAGGFEVIEFPFAGSFDTYRTIPLATDLSGDAVLSTSKVIAADERASFALMSEFDDTVQVFVRDGNQTARQTGSLTLPGLCAAQWVYLRLIDAFVFAPSLHIGTDDGLWTFMNESARGTNPEIPGTFEFSRIEESTGNFCHAAAYQSFFDETTNELIVLDTDSYGAPDFPLTTHVDVPEGLRLVALKDGKIKHDVEYFALLFAGEHHTSAHRLTLLYKSSNGLIEQRDIDLPSGIPSDLIVQSIDTNFFDLQYGRGEGNRDMDIVIAAPETPYVYVVTVDKDSLGELTFSPLEFFEVGFGIKDIMLAVTDGTNRYSLLTNDGTTLNMHESALEFSRF